jgi:hypothetical protein
MNCGQALILSDGARNVATILLSDGARKVVGRAIDRTSRDCMSRAIDRPWHAFRLQVTCRFVPWIQFHRKRVDSKSHSSATAIQFSIQQFFKRTYALNNWASLPIGNFSTPTPANLSRTTNSAKEGVYRCSWWDRETNQEAQIKFRFRFFRKDSKVCRCRIPVLHDCTSAKASTEGCELDTASMSTSAMSS